MFETLLVLPPGFWVAVGLLALGASWASGQIKNGLGLPVLAVLATVAAWYVGDVLYNDYRGDYAQKFSSTTLANAWWQVAWFVAVFLVLTPIMHRMVNGRYLHQGSQFLQMLKTSANRPAFQLHLNQLFWGCAAVWLALSALSVYRVGIHEVPYYFFPFLGHKAEPWGRGRIGGGIDSLLSLAYYLQMFVGAAFGVVAALAQDRRVRFWAMAGCLPTWSYFIFDRSRSYMLVVVMPAILTWVFLRLRGSAWLKAAVLVPFYLLVNTWFGFVIANRSATDIASAFQQQGLSLEQPGDVRHEGLNMYEELCWINALVKEGTFAPKWGQEYFTEIVNPIPRTLWPGKPMIGIDYAIARGQSWDQGEAGVAATISTGMIGQGVVNFGRIIGPAFAALLMSLWAAILARLDLTGQKVGRLLLFALGLILTFNLGRDITLIILYAFIFGAAIVWWVERFSKHPERRTRGAMSGGQRAEEEREAESRKQKAEIGNVETVKSEILKAESGKQKPETLKTEMLKEESGGRHSGFGWWQKSQTNAEPVPTAKTADGQAETLKT
jgi:ABC-type multidrug transport system fused ATPase/permease subunit